MANPSLVAANATKVPNRSQVDHTAGCTRLARRIMRHFHHIIHLEKTIKDRLISCSKTCRKEFT